MSNVDGKKYHRDVQLPKKIELGLVTLKRIKPDHWVFKSIREEAEADSADVDFKKNRKYITKDANDGFFYVISDASFLDTSVFDPKIKATFDVKRYRPKYRPWIDDTKKKKEKEKITPMSHFNEDKSVSIIAGFKIYDPDNPYDGYTWIRKDFRGLGYSKYLIEELDVRDLCSVKTSYKSWRRMGFFLTGQFHPKKGCKYMYRPREYFETFKVTIPVLDELPKDYLYLLGAYQIEDDRYRVVQHGRIMERKIFSDYPALTSYTNSVAEINTSSGFKIKRTTIINDETKPIYYKNHSNGPGFVLYEEATLSPWESEGPTKQEGTMGTPRFFTTTKENWSEDHSSRRKTSEVPNADLIV